MKTASLIIIGIFCFFAGYGMDSTYADIYSSKFEYKYEREKTLSSIADAYLPSEAAYPLQVEPFAQTAQSMSSSGLDDETELGGIERPANVGGGMFALLLFSLGYCFKRYRSIGKKNDSLKSQ